MKKIKYILLILICISIPIRSQVLATFEDGNTDELTMSGHWFTSELFVNPPGIYSNPDKTGINISDKCFGAVNAPNADWWGNFYSLNLTAPITITESNRYLTFLMYRSIQPKEIRIGFNSYEETDQIFFGKTNKDATWEKITIDLGAARMGQTLNAIFFVFSCNWSEPRNGWGDAEYYFDNFELSGILPSLPTAKVEIDASQVFQTIDGFAASDCWTGNYVGKYWEESKKEFIAEKFFSREFDEQGNPKGIGLSMWRVNMGAGTWEQGDAGGIDDISRRAECFLDENGNYDWENKQIGQQYFMQKAKDYGCESFVAFSNSPLTIYTRNGKGYANGDGNSNLKEDMYDDYAEYLTTVVKHFKDKGYNFTHISPVNEPQYTWTGGQEGTPWQNNEIKKLATELDKSIQSKGLDTKLLLTEAASWEYLYKTDGRASNQIYELFNSTSHNYVGNLSSVAPVVAGHSYWTFNNNSTIINVRETLKDMADRHGLKVYQTEWSMLDSAPNDGTFPGYENASYMDIALFMSKLIHSDLVYAGVSSWSYWTGMDTERWSHKNRFFLIGLYPEGHAYGDIRKSGDVLDMANLWTLGNYSLFVKPGYKRIQLNGAAEMNDLLGSAYISPDNTTLVAVYVNNSKSSREIETSLSQFKTRPISVRKYVTTDTKKLERDASLEENNVSANITVEPRSVTTIVYQLEKSDDNNLDNVTVNSQDWNVDTRYIVDCDNHDSNLKIEIIPSDNNAVVSPAKIINVDISKPSVQQVEFTIESQTGAKKDYKVEVEKRFDFNQLIVQKWNNTLIVNEKSNHADGFKFTGYQWYKDGQPIGQNKPSYSAGSKSTDVLDKDATYYVTLTTDKGDKISTCPGKVTLKDLGVKVYPNPISANEKLTIEANLSQELLDNGSIQIYSLTGTKTNISVPMNGKTLNEITIPSSGMYVIKLTSINNFEYTAKILVR